MNFLSLLTKTIKSIGNYARVLPYLFFTLIFISTFRMVFLSSVLQVVLQVACTLGMSKLSGISLAAVATAMVVSHLGVGYLIIFLGMLGIPFSSTASAEFCQQTCLSYFVLTALAGILILGIAGFFTTIDPSGCTRCFISSTFFGSTLFAVGCIRPIHKDALPCSANWKSTGKRS